MINTDLWSTVWKIILASVIMGIFIQLGKYLTGYFINLNTGFNVAIQSVLVIIFGFMIYLLLTKILGLREAEKIISKIKKPF